MPKDKNTNNEVDNYIQLYEQMQMSLEKAQSEEDKNLIRQRFDQTVEGFDENIIMQAFKKMDSMRDSKAMGSLMVPPEREGYAAGAIAKLIKSAAKKVDDKLESQLYKQTGIDEDTPGVIATPRGAVVGKKKVKAFGDVKTQKGGIYGGAAGITASELLDMFDGNEQALVAYAEANDDLPSSSEASEFEKAFSKAFKAGEDTFEFKGKTYTTELKRGQKAFGGVLKAISKRLGKKQGAEDIAEMSTKELMELDESAQIEAMGKLLGYSNKEILKLVKDSKTDPKIYENLTDELIEMNELMKERLGKADGGPMPVDTYNNISPEEEMQQAEDMLPDDEMEEEYVDYVAEEVLEPEEQEYLFKVLDEDPKLEGILDKIILNATEFAGSGEVEGPGTGISDSIPARLSDGEFVITRKATDQIGADNLQKMMDDAERAYDGGLMGMANGGEAGTNPFVNPEEIYGVPKDGEEDIQRQMLYSSRMPSLMNR